MAKTTSQHPFAEYQVIDLTHRMNTLSPTWEGYCGYRHHLLLDYDRGCRVQSVKIRSGGGTHIDAPMHFIQGGKDVASLELDNLIAPVYVIDISQKAHQDYYLSHADVLAFEDRYGKIAPRSFVIIRTGWDKHWETAMYRNVDAEGNMHFPGLTAESAELLLARDVVGIGIDTMSPDCLDLTFPVHHILLGADRYIVENLANCAALPPVGSFTLILPLKAEALTEAPIRALGLVPKQLMAENLSDKYHHESA